MASIVAGTAELMVNGWQPDLRRNFGQPRAVSFAYAAVGTLLGPGHDAAAAAMMAG